MKTGDQLHITKSPSSSNLLRKGLIAGYLVISLFAIFYLPYFFPVAASTSDSYTFGYNNKVGIVLLLFFVSCGAIWTRGINLKFLSTGPSPKIPLKYLGLALVVEFGACTGTYLFAGRYGAYSEAEYELLRIWLLSQGKRPYIDFEWSYGSGLLYIPKWFSDVTRLSIPHSYFALWTFASLAGVVFLFVTINLVDYPSTRKTTIFWLLFFCALFSVTNMGVHYTWLRYLCPTSSLLVIYKIGSFEASIRARIKAALLAIAFTCALILISPEVAIAHALACIVILFPGKQPFWRKEQLIVFLGMATSLTALFIGGAKLRMLDSIFSKGQGTDSFPIVFAPSTVFYFCAVFISACYLVQRMGKEEIRDNTFVLIAFSVPMMAAALGRCDPGHILTNGIGFFIALFFYVSANLRMWRLCVRAFIALFLIVLPVIGILMSYRLFESSSLPVFPKGSNPYLLYSQASFSKTEELLEAPFGYWPDASGFYYSPQIDYGFYDGLLDAGTPGAYRVKIGELAQHPQRPLLLHKGILGVCEVHEQSSRAFIGIVFAFPYTARVAHPESVRKPLCDYIVAHYALAEPATPQNFQYELWRPKP